MSKAQVNGTELYYELTGQGAETVVLLHGLGSCTQDWECQVPILSKKFRVLTIDMRGHGQSAKSHGPFGIPQLSNDVIAIMDLLQINSAHLLGLSMGGMMAFQMAVSYPARIKSLIIVNSAPGFIIPSLYYWFLVWQRLFFVRVMGMNRLGKIIAGDLLPKVEHSEVRERLIQRFPANDKQIYLATLWGFIGWSVEDEIKNIDVPVYAIAADNDYTPISLKEEYIEKLPNGRLDIVEDSRHLTPIDQSEKFNQMVMGFYEDIMDVS